MDGVIGGEPPATLLVVDDDPLNRRLLVRSLERDGHQTVEAADRREALEVLRDVEPDVGQLGRGARPQNGPVDASLVTALVAEADAVEADLRAFA